MSESTNENPNEPTVDDGATDTEKVFRQAEVDRIIADRLKREDVKGLKAKAAEYDKLLEAQKTAEQKAADAHKAAEQRAVEAEARAIRYQVAAENGITKDDADLFLTGTDEDTITAQAKRLAERVADQKRAGNHVPNEGRTHDRAKASKGDQFADFANNFFTR